MFLTTANNMALSRLPVLCCTVILPLNICRTFDSDISDCFTSSDILDSHRFHKVAVEIRFRGAPVPGGHGTGHIVSFSALVETRTKYANCSATVTFEA